MGRSPRRGWKRRHFSPKRRIRKRSPGNKDKHMLEDLAQRVKYGGSPLHKRSPGDFGLTPPSQPRPDKTLCDGVNIFHQEEAERLLKEGARRGLVSEFPEGGFPTNIWAVTDDGKPLEARGDRGRYHGYPMPPQDPFRDEVLARWNER